MSEPSKSHIKNGFTHELSVNQLDSKNGQPGLEKPQQLESGEIKDVVQGPERQAWGGKLEFIITLIGYCVGLGNVWRFPYLVFKNGGGAFLIPYFIMLLLVGMPVFFLEVAFGQFASLSPVTIWSVTPILKGVGFATIIVGTMIALYYNVIVAWSMYYLFASMTNYLPWQTCSNPWNTRVCSDGTNATIHTKNFTNITTPTEEYFYRNVLGMDDNSGLDNLGGVKWQLALLLLLSWLIIFLVLLKGIGSLGKVSYFTSLFPYVMMTIMLIRGATLDGSLDGVKFYLTPKWGKLGDATVWGDAATQIFYSLGTCMAGLISMASYNQFNNNIMRDAILLPIINCLTSFYCGFVIFATLGYMAKQKGVSVEDVVASGPGLVFVVYPEGLAKMPVAPLWAILFFIMMSTLGFSSQFSTVEGVVAALMDEFPRYLRNTGKTPYILRGVFCIVLFLLGLPIVTQGGFTLFNIMDSYSGGYPLLVIGFMEVIALNYVYGFRRWTEDISMMIGNKPVLLFILKYIVGALWCLITPALLIFTFVFKAVQEKGPVLNGYTYPPVGKVLAGLIAAFPISAIFIFFIGYYLWTCKVKGFAFKRGLEVLKIGITPAERWGPALPENKTGRYAPEEVQNIAISPKDALYPEIKTAEPPPSYDNVAYSPDTAISHL